MGLLSRLLAFEYGWDRVRFSSLFQNNLAARRCLTPQNNPCYDQCHYDDDDRYGQRYLPTQHDISPPLRLVLATVGDDTSVVLHGVFVRAGIAPSHCFGVTICEGHIHMSQEGSQLVVVGWVHVYSPVVAPSEVGVSHRSETARQVSIVTEDIQIATADSVKVNAVH